MSSKPYTNTYSCNETSLSDTVIAAQRGDRQAFGYLVERYQRAVYGLVYRRLRNHAEAQELCQDVFIQAMKKLDQLEEPRCFGSWLRAIARRMSINFAMRRRTTVSIETVVLDSQKSEYKTPLMTMLDKERCLEVRREMQKLRELDQQTLKAFYFDGQSLLEMSRRFSSPVGTVKRRLHIARKRLAQKLEPICQQQG